MAGDESWPTPLMMPYIENNTLYAYYETSWWNDDENADCNSQLWVFDLQSGEYNVIELPQTYGICAYKEGQMLLLRRAQDGRMFLSVYDLTSHTVTTEEICSLPMSVNTTGFASVAARIGGLAYHKASDSIVYADISGIWQSTREGTFQKIDLEQPLWDEMPFLGRAWIMRDGSYAFPNGGKYLIQASSICKK